MSTITLDIEPELIKKAENVLNDIGISYPDAVKLFTKQIIVRNALPIELRGEKRPPFPCIDNATTDEEVIRLFEEGMESVKEGRTYTAEEIEKELQERYEYAIAL